MGGPVRQTPSAPRHPHNTPSWGAGTGWAVPASARLPELEGPLRPVLSEGLCPALLRAPPGSRWVGSQQTAGHPGPGSLHREESAGRAASVMNRRGSLKGQVIPKSPVAPGISQAKLHTATLL